jgi:hypothetical protein
VISCSSTPKNGQEFTNWDDHSGNGGRLGHFGGYMRTRLPYLDQALSALIEDIYSRGIDRKILVVVVGEFGRTPRLSHNNLGTGRDHWPQAYTALVSGGGLRMGQVVGATNSKAEFPTERPYTPQDLLATVYRHLGIDTSRQFIDHSGRPIPILPSGEPIRRNWFDRTTRSIDLRAAPSFRGENGNAFDCSAIACRFR